MDITWTYGEPLEDRTRRAATITITLAAEDDPDGHIAGLLIRDRLEAFLTAYPRPTGAYNGCETQGDAYSRLLAFAYVTNMCATRLDSMQLEARDRWGMGWGTIANAAGSSRSTVKGQVLSARARNIERGAWYDAAGLHRGIPAEAYAATETVFAVDNEDQS